MKRYSLYTIIFLLGMFILGSCSDDEFDKSSKVKEGIPAKLTLSIATSQMQKVTTKAALTDADFNAVYDVYVFVYDKNHNLEYSEDFASTDPNTTKTGNVTLSKAITSGVKYIYAIANATKYTDVKAALDALQKGSSFNDLNALTYTMSNNTVQRVEGALLMSGAFVSSEGSDGSTGYCLLDVTSENEAVTASGEIQLKHLDAQIKFVVKVANDTIKFTPRGWAVYNVPKNSNLMEKTSDVASQTLFSIADANFETASTTGGSFTFYMMENRKAAKDTPSSVNARESMSGANYVYADANAAYVQIKGSYEAVKEGKLYTYGEVVYTIHLGDFMTNFDNFNNERNTDYTYTITVKGVNNIVAEVLAQTEDENDGAEGAIYRSTSQFVMDAHYGTAVVTFYKKDVSKNDVFVAVTTPYVSNGKYYNGTASSDFDNDYKWVKFVRNSNASTDFAQYPGTTSNTLLDIKEVINELENNSSIWTGGKVTYTAFVDEYYYDDSGSKGWKTFTNADDRTFSIYTNPMISYDGKSSYSEPTFRITQRSIKSFYNIGLESLTSAWGAETINENTKQLPVSNTDHYGNINTVQAKSNGRYCSWYQLRKYNDGDLKWSDFINYKTNTLKSEKSYADYAFLTRNRDLDGDNIIDDDELRWYTCATNQYVGMWVGQSVLPAETYLFQGDISAVTEDNRFDYHLLSSNNIRFWPEEGVSTGSNGYDNIYYIRCARNLGGYYTGKPTESKQPLNYVIAGTNNGLKYIDLSRMSPKALRSTIITTIKEGPEHEGGELNQPYTSFTIYSSNSKKSCPSGYRIPNQRELALMAGFVPNLTTQGTNLGSTTYSNLGYKSGGYYLMMYDPDVVGQFLSINENQKSTTYRCIKDGK